ncbi:Uncharacterised protein [Vibrio cholerae]|nr:Uncharacterised protein [Vibrio cholerae]
MAIHRFRDFFVGLVLFFFCWQGITIHKQEFSTV